MHVRPAAALWLLISLILLNFSASAAPEQGRTRYQALYNALAPGLVFGEFERLVSVQHVYSKRDDVRADSIRVSILSKSGRIELVPDQAGRVDFPMTTALLEENPWVESNQPQGSLGLSATMELKISGAREIPYLELFEAMQQAQAALEKLGPPMSARRVRGVDLLFDANAEASVTIEDAKSEELALANAGGVISIRMNEAWVKSKARVRMSAALKSARPRID
jgi:hypothetical protein